MGRAADEVERVMGIEPTFTAWEAVGLPLDDTRIGQDYGCREARTAMQSLTMQVHLNGDTREIASGQTLAALLEQSGLVSARVAVELNGRIVPRARHAEQALSEGDRIEIVHALGGG